jgi:hypothetical protein
MKLLPVFLLIATLNASEPAPRTAVLAELFTSEGCSSCPSADALLMKLDKLQPVAGAQIVVLSEHVDYWNSLGWSDPFSSPAFTQRQEMYARTLRDDSYTPQLVIDGRAALVGSNEREILPAIAKAATRPKTAVHVESVRREGNEAVVRISTGALTSKADLWIAVADEHDQSSVRRGENSGRTLNHVAVVRTLGKSATVAKGASFEKEVRAPLGPQAGPMRVVVFLSEAGGGIIGSAVAELP